MRKNNWIILCIAVVVSAYLLWLWYWLEFDHVDAPLDLALSIIWWILIAVIVLVIRHVEKKRQERVRTCYVAQGIIFNSEAGTRTFENPDELGRRIHDILAELEYGFDIQDIPEDTEFQAVVRSKTFDLKRREDEVTGVEEQLKWHGEVAFPARSNDDPLPFDGQEELQGILDRLWQDAE